MGAILEGLMWLSPTARAALEADSRYILQRGILGGMGSPTSTPGRSARAHRLGDGVGSVGQDRVDARRKRLALDAGVDVLVVLAGTRLSLWRQTFERLATQLDGGRVQCPEGFSTTASPDP